MLHLWFFKTYTCSIYLTTKPFTNKKWLTPFVVLSPLNTCFTYWHNRADKLFHLAPYMNMITYYSSMGFIFLLQENLILSGGSVCTPCVIVDVIVPITCMHHLHLLHHHQQHHHHLIIIINISRFPSRTRQCSISNECA